MPSCTKKVCSGCVVVGCVVVVLVVVVVVVVVVCLVVVIVVVVVVVVVIVRLHTPSMSLFLRVCSGCVVVVVVVLPYRTSGRTLGAPGRREMLLVFFVAAVVQVITY